MRQAWFLGAAILVVAGAQAQDPPEAASGLEFGVRYWAAGGKTERAHDASQQFPAAGNPTSVLTYDKLYSNIAELYARKPFGERWFVKGNVGIGSIRNGRLVDQDYDSAFGQQILVFETVSGLSGNLRYGTIDIGRDMWKSGNTTFGVFLGYNYWNERLDAYGFSNTGQSFFVFSVEPGDNVPVISNDLTWQSARVGVEMRSVRGHTRFSAELAFVPYAKYRNEDSHWLRQSPGDLGPAPNVIATGHGWGGQAELEVRRTYPQYFGLDFGVGLRYWKLKSSQGSQTQGSLEFPIVDLQSERFGVMLSAGKSW
jgi:hypothetical protein